MLHLSISDIFNMSDFVPLLFAVGSWFYIIIWKPCFSFQVGASGVSKGEASVIKAIQGCCYLGNRDAIAGVDVILILACEAAHVTDVAAMRRHYGFTLGTMSDRDGWSLSSPFHIGLFSPQR